MNSFTIGNVISFLINLVDKNNQPVNTDKLTITIDNQSSSLRETYSLTPTATGVYSYDYHTINKVVGVYFYHIQATGTYEAIVQRY